MYNLLVHIQCCFAIFHFHQEEPEFVAEDEIEDLDISDIEVNAKCDFFELRAEPLINAFPAALHPQLINGHSQAQHWKKI